MLKALTPTYLQERINLMQLEIFIKMRKNIITRLKQQDKSEYARLPNKKHDAPKKQ